MDTDTTEIFDLNDYLKRVMQDRELGKSLIDEFLSELPGRLDELENAVKAGNAEHARQIAHLIKGEAASISAQKLSRTASMMELAAKNGNLPEQQSILPRLHEEAGLLVVAIDSTIF